MVQIGLKYGLFKVSTHSVLSNPICSLKNCPLRKCSLWLFFWTIQYEWHGWHTIASNTCLAALSWYREGQNRRLSSVRVIHTDRYSSKSEGFAIFRAFEFPSPLLLERRRKEFTMPIAKPSELDEFLPVHVMLIENRWFENRWNKGSWFEDSWFQDRQFENRGFMRM